MRPQWGEDGAYTTDVLPTADGDYTWHIWGTIENTPVDVSMMSGPETFGAVKAKSTVAFPAAESTPAELTSLPLVYRGKVRDVYGIDERHLLIVEILCFAWLVLLGVLLFQIAERRAK